MPEKGKNNKRDCIFLYPLDILYIELKGVSIYK